MVVKAAAWSHDSVMESLPFDTGGARPEDLAETEAGLAMRLPEPLVEVLRRHNGGVPTRSAFHVPALGATSLVRLFSAGEAGGHGLAAVADLLAMDDLPADMTTIGEDPGGNLLLVDPAGAVHFRASCGWPVGDTPRLVRVANSVAGFLAALLPISSIAPSQWAVDYGKAASTAGRPEWGRMPPDGYHWHFDVPSQQLQLVPRDIHWMAPHVSDPSLTAWNKSG